jgi:predicted lactoylglutathione lyase
MKLNTVSVSSTDLSKTTQFYTLVGFKFGSIKADGKHVESISTNDSVRLMIDSQDVIADIIGESPKPSNHSGFALEYENPTEVDAAVKHIQEAGFTVTKESWDAFWGRYAVVEDPDGYKVDLYASLTDK